MIFPGIIIQTSKHSNASKHDLSPPFNNYHFDCDAILKNIKSDENKLYSMQRIQLQKRKKSKHWSTKF